MTSTACWWRRSRIRRRRRCSATSCAGTATGARSSSRSCWPVWSRRASCGRRTGAGPALATSPRPSRPASASRSTSGSGRSRLTLGGCSAPPRCWAGPSSGSCSRASPRSTGAPQSTACRAAIDEQLIEVDGDGFTFRHALTREAVLHDLLPPERRDLATRAWPAHERANPGLPGPTLELAAELAEAAGERVVAARHLVESARRAVDNGALVTAEATARRATRLAVGDQAVAFDADEALVHVLVTVGKPSEALALGRDLAARLEATGAPASRRADLLAVTAMAALAAGDGRGAADDAAAARGRGRPRRRRCVGGPPRCRRRERRARPSRPRHGRASGARRGGGCISDGPTCGAVRGPLRRRGRGPHDERDERGGALVRAGRHGGGRRRPGPAPPPRAAGAGAHRVDLRRPRAPLRRPQHGGPVRRADHRRGHGPEPRRHRSLGVRPGDLPQLGAVVRRCQPALPPGHRGRGAAVAGGHARAARRPRRAGCRHRGRAGAGPGRPSDPRGPLRPGAAHQCLRRRRARAAARAARHDDRARAGGPRHGVGLPRPDPLGAAADRRRRRPRRNSAGRVRRGGRADRAGRLRRLRRGDGGDRPWPVGRHRGRHRPVRRHLRTAPVPRPQHRVDPRGRPGRRRAPPCATAGAIPSAGCARRRPSSVAVATTSSPGAAARCSARRGSRCRVEVGGTRRSRRRCGRSASRAGRSTSSSWWRRAAPTRTSRRSWCCRPRPSSGTCRASSPAWGWATDSDLAEQAAPHLGEPDP